MDRYDADRLADTFIQRLEDEGIIDRSLIKNKKPLNETAPDKAVIIKFMEKPMSDFVWSPNGELYVITTDESQGQQKVVIDPTTTDIKEVQESILKSLPAVPFDVHQGGVKSKQLEAKSLYVILVLNAVCGNVWKNEIQACITDFDFTTMKDSNGDMPFRQLLEDVMLETTRVLDLVVATCYLKLTSEELKKIRR